MKCPVCLVYNPTGEAWTFAGNVMDVAPDGTSRLLPLASGTTCGIACLLLLLRQVADTRKAAQ